MSKKDAVLDQTNMDIWDSLISSGDLATLQNMIRKSKISIKDKLGEYELSPLHLAARYNQPDTCEFLISEGVSSNIRESFSKKNPLHIAAYFGHLDVAETLIDLGAESGIGKGRDILGCLPLHYAALGEQKEMMFTLLKVGHSIEPSNYFTKKKGFGVSSGSYLGNVLDILIRKRNFDLCELFSAVEGISVVETNPRVHSTLYIGYANENPWTPFHSAAVLGDKKIVEMLFNRFPHAYCFCEEFTDSFDYSPGEVALAEGHTEIASMLGEKRTSQAYRRTFEIFSVQKGAVSIPYAVDLLKSLKERDFVLMERLIAEHGAEILCESVFCEKIKSVYMSDRNLNALSVLSRLFGVSLADFLKKKGVVLPKEEFLSRDQKEMVFFNWAMLDSNPYAMGFFFIKDFISGACEIFCD